MFLDVKQKEIFLGDYIRHYPNFCHGKTNGHGNAINLYSGVIARNIYSYIENGIAEI